MGMFDYVNFEMDCPRCGERANGFQSKDDLCLMDKVEIEAVLRLYTSCRACGHWIELTRVPPELEPVERKEPATYAKALELGFRLVSR